MTPRIHQGARALLSVFLFISFTHAAKTKAGYPSHIAPIKADRELIVKDVSSLLSKVSGLEKVKTKVFFNLQNKASSVEVGCEDKILQLTVNSPEQELSATLYFGLYKLGFLFPHPRKTVIPPKDKVLSHCGKSYSWSPAFKYRGFHLHTLHPNEWVYGFLMGNTKVAKELIYWLARNQQNAFDLNLLRIKRKNINKWLPPLFRLARQLGVVPGASLGFALHQQNSFKLLGLFSSLTGIGDKGKLVKNLRKLIKDLKPGFVTLEPGTSEFTPVAYKRAIKWNEWAGDVCEEEGVQLFIKVHVSSNQVDEELGNFNFLPQYNDSNVGIWPHTVMFYSLFDDYVPMYGNKSFKEMYAFLKQEKDSRPTWYYPETSYYIAMDIDAPLFLTTYLTNRALEMKKLSEDNLEGHINFTTGHEAGYWLMDWVVAQMNNKDFEFNPLNALKELGEDPLVWQEVLNYQDLYFKDKGLISILSFPNFQDELTAKHRIHERNTLKELIKEESLLKNEVELLKEAIKNRPSLSKIEDKELKGYLEITWLRLEHALATRESLLHPKSSPLRESKLTEAKQIRLKAQRIFQNQKLRYPEIPLHQKFKNPTSYDYGYLWTGQQMHFWHREEQQAEKEKFSPFFMNIWNILDIVF